MNVYPSNGTFLSGNEQHNPSRFFTYLQSTPFIITSVALVLSATLFTASKTGRKFVQSFYWTLDHFLGGAPHTVALPGPPGLPLVGNLFQLEGGHIQKLDEWIKDYGDVIRVALGEREAIVINSHSAMAKTIVAQGPAFQSRPTFKLFHSDFASSGIWTVGTSPYSDRLVRTRKALSGQIAPRVLPAYVPTIHPKLRKLIRRVSEASSGPALDMAEILHRFGTGQVSEQLVGTALSDDVVALLAENETNIFRQRTIGAPARDYIPILRGWSKLKYVVLSRLGKVKGADEKEEKAREYRKTQQVYINTFLKDLRKRVDDGDDVPSILGNIMRSGTLKDEEVLLASYTGIAAGVNLGYTLTWIIGFLANHPEMQEKGYQAIREIYHGDAPEPHDFDRVEYVKALHTEGSRYYTPVRLGFPRQTLSESTYKGVTIPAGVLTIMNLHAANRDPTVFDSPNSYIPERWMNGHRGRTDSLEEGGEKIGVPHLTYGAGRRVCPGIDMANRSIYSTLVLLLHFFTWERAPIAESEKERVFPPFRAQRECTPDMDPVVDTATPTEAQAIPWSCGIKFTPRDKDTLLEWLSKDDSL